MGVVEWSFIGIVLCAIAVWGLHNRDKRDYLEF